MAEASHKSHGTSLRTPIARVRGLGAAKEGVGHWWMQRMTALALIPLGLWFVASVVCLAGADHAAITQWLSAPFTLGALALTLFAAFYHAVLGLQVVVEDYVHGKFAKHALVILIQFAGFGFATAAIIALLVAAFAG
ncbi:succinate dehydrogenase, hydrophobic membrane anchor protein [Dongia sp.]|uniref:succinate dehydrogenase, hydrophobic membrane anchor protein n=1 Tax=Dongia sp. TaxID=1977262 RepID=UPI00375207F3